MTRPAPRILSIQSWVADGRVGNAAALFPLQRLGAEVHAIHTVQFSNHPGHGAFTGRTTPPGDIAALIAGLDAYGTLARTDALLTGYLGSPEIGATLLDAARRLRAHRPAALWCCDPVIGDDGRDYVPPGVASFFAERALPEADLLTPNAHELARLTARPPGHPWATRAEAAQAARALAMMLRPAGPRAVLVTSLTTPETSPDALDLLLAVPDAAWHLAVPRLPGKFHGAGDTLAALFLFHALAGAALPEAAARAAASLHAILAETAASGATELATIAVQDRLAAPPGGVVPVRL